MTQQLLKKETLQTQQKV